MIERGFAELEAIIGSKVPTCQIYDFKFHLSVAQRLWKYRQPDEHWVMHKNLLQTLFPKTEILAKFSPVGLQQQIRNIMHATIEPITFTTAFTLEDVENIREEALSFKNRGGDYAIYAFKIFGLLRDMENNLLSNEEIAAGQYTPFGERVTILTELATGFGDEETSDAAQNICSLLSKLCQEVQQEQQKHKFLRSLITHRENTTKHILVVVPKEAQREQLARTLRYDNWVTVTIPQKIDFTSNYDLIVVSGKMYLHDIPLFLHANTARLILLLYSFEEDWFHAQLTRFEQFLARWQGESSLEAEAEPPTDDAADWELNVSGDGWDKIFDDYLQRLGKFDITNGLKTVPVSCAAILSDGRIFLFSQQYKVNVVNMATQSYKTVPLADLEVGVTFIYSRDLGNRDEMLNLALIAMGESRQTIEKAEGLVDDWKNKLRRYMRANGLKLNELHRRLRMYDGYKLSSSAPLRTWLYEEYGVIGPRDTEVFRAIGRIIGKYSDSATWEEYAAATKYLRDKRQKANMEITRRVPRIYAAERLQGKQATREKPLDKVIRENLDDLVMLLDFLCLAHFSLCSQVGMTPLERSP